MIYGLLFWGVIFFLYWLPSFAAKWNGKPNRQTIYIVNFFLGWTFIGWVVALAMAMPRQKDTAPVVEKPPEQTPG